MRSPPDSAIADLLQAGLPLTPHPYLEIADALGCGEAFVIDTTARLMSSGAIRSFGAFVDYEALGCDGVLCGVAADDGIEAAAKILSARGDVTHNYLRGGRIGLWFTALFKEGGAAGIERALLELGHPFVMLRTISRIKLRPCFRLGSDDAPYPAAYSEAEREEIWERPRERRGEPIDATSLDLLAYMQENFPVTTRPFAEIAQKIGMDERELIARLASLKERGVLRRVGASLHHVRAGYSSNALLAIDAGDEDACARAGRDIARRSWVSHCYVRGVRRSTLPFEWPYRLYAMIHARSGGELARMIAEIKEAISPRGIEAMPTLREFKKSRYPLKEDAK
jgi:DNA-binding Lrp family transcriptional regulator